MDRLGEVCWVIIYLVSAFLIMGGVISFFSGPNIDHKLPPKYCNRCGTRKDVYCEKKYNQATGDVADVNYGYWACTCDDMAN